MIWIIALIIAITVIIRILFLRSIEENLIDKQKQCKELEQKITDFSNNILNLEDKKAQLDESILRAQEAYKIEVSRANEEIANFRQQKIADQDAFFAQRDKDKQNELERLFAQRQDEYVKSIIELADETEEKKQEIRDEYERVKQELTNFQNYYSSLLEPVRAISRAKDEVLFQTIQVSEEERRDIAYLLNEVLPNLQHPDILRKLIWSEFIQKPTNEMLKRTEIDDSPGIYKITNIDNKKCYVGKSTNVKKRLQDHVKGALGISSISDQKIHREMAREGIWNFTFERLCSCEKDELNSKEKEYIAFFNSTQYGYNIASGG